MLKAILLDLDNTLILYDEPAFYTRYFKKLYLRFSDHFTPEEFRRRIITSTMSLRDNQGLRNNYDYFMDSFCAELPKLRKEFQNRFMAFYGRDFDKIRVEVTAAADLHATLEQLQRMGIKLVLASNPLFPRIALEKRLGWVGVDGASFDFITHMENMSYVKPHTGYYRQICDQIESPPQKCMMVGNDAVNDMSAAQAGLKTYLTTEAGEIDYSSLRLADMPRLPKRRMPRPDFKGPLAGVVGVVRRLST